MSIRVLNNCILDIYIKKELINIIDFNDKEVLEEYLKKLFKILSNKYNIKIEGFYNITVYKDLYYGVIFHLEKEELEYYEYFKNQVDMRIIIIDTEFLYRVDDLPINNLNKFAIIVKNNEIYLKIKQELSNLEMIKLMENSKLVYNI